jgi:integrase
MLVPNTYGIWQIDLTVNGERVRKSTKTKDKKLAEKLHALTEAEMLKGSWGIGKKSYSLEDAYRKAMLEHWKGKKSSYKVEQNWTLLSEILDTSKDVSSVDSKVISELKSKLKAKGNSGATINRKMAVLRALLNLCVEWGNLPYAPKIKAEDEAEPRHRVLTDEEEISMMRFFSEKYPEQAGLFEFLLSSANRLSEALKLTWFDIDFKNNQVTFRDTKSGSTLVKPMTQVMRRVLESRKGLIRPFPYTVDMVESYWKHLRKFLGYDAQKDFVIHCLRHTCASRLVIAGMDLKRVQLWLGHKSYATTLLYAQLPPEYMSDVVLALNDAKDFDHTLSYDSQSQNSSSPVANLRVL